MASTSNVTKCCLSMLQVLSSPEMFVHTTQASLVSTKSPFNGFLTFQDTQVSVRQFLTYVVQVAIDVLGVIANVINIIVFSKIGLNDSVTVVLFALAISDLGFLFLSGMSQIISILDATVGLRPFEPLKNLAFEVLWWYNMFYDITIFIMVFNAVQKCACVAIPLIFKSVFTRFRSVIIVTVIYVAVFLYYVPIFASPGTWTKFDYTRNWTRLFNFYHPSNEQLYEVFHMFSRIVLPFVSQVVIIFCMVILTIKLRAAVKARRSMGVGRELSESADNEAFKNKVKSNAKELRAIQTVTLVSAIFVVCNLPDILITFTARFSLEFGDSKTHESTYRMCSAIQDVLGVANSAVNIVVYLKYNSKYRQKFKEITGVILRFGTR